MVGVTLVDQGLVSRCRGVTSKGCACSVTAVCDFAAAEPLRQGGYFCGWHLSQCPTPTRANSTLVPTQQQESSQTSQCEATQLSQEQRSQINNNRKRALERRRSLIVVDPVGTDAQASFSTTLSRTQAPPLQLSQDQRILVAEKRLRALKLRRQKTNEQVASSTQASEAPLLQVAPSGVQCSTLVAVSSAPTGSALSVVVENCAATESTVVSAAECKPLLEGARPVLPIRTRPTEDGSEALGPKAPLPSTPPCGLHIVGQPMPRPAPTCKAADFVCFHVHHDTPRNHSPWRTPRHLSMDLTDPPLPRLASNSPAFSRVEDSTKYKLETAFPHVDDELIGADADELAFAHGDSVLYDSEHDWFDVDVLW